MIKKNEEYIVDIIDNGCEGEGIAKIDGITIFINQAIKGEKVRIKILKVLKNYAYGKILEFIEKSEYRAETECETYNPCGGCSLRHCTYGKTLEMKKDIVLNVLRKALIKDVKVNDVIGMESPYFYRNKLQYPVGIDKQGEAILGIYSQRTHNIVKTEKCYIQNEKCQEIANDVLNFIKNNKIAVYNEQTLKGTVRHIIARIGVRTNEVLLTIVLNDDKFSNKEKFIKEIVEKNPEVKSIVLNYNTKNTNVILGDKNETIYGNGYIQDKLGEYIFNISSMSFYQVNPIQTEKLYNIAVGYVGAGLVPTHKEDVALDLYCGIGTIGIFGSKYFKKVYGIEIIEDAIRDAKENAKINNINNIEFFAGDVEKVLPKIIEKEKIKPEVVFVDPPRKGLDKNTVEFLSRLKPKQIIYISCNPATLARDLKILSETYEVKKIQPVDMFPWTSHVECCVLLEIKKDL